MTKVHNSEKPILNSVSLCTFITFANNICAFLSYYKMQQSSLLIMYIIIYNAYKMHWNICATQKIVHTIRHFVANIFW